MKFAVVIEEAPDGSYGGYVPDLPGIGVGGNSREEVLERLQEATTFYFEREEPRKPRASVEYIEVTTPQSHPKRKRA